MMTLRQLAAEPPTIPTRTGWYLADLGEAKGKFELYTRQSPQKLKVLREHALIESAISSNRIEGVEVDQSRIATLMFGKPALRNRDEEWRKRVTKRVMTRPRRNESNEQPSTLNFQLSTGVCGSDPTPYRRQPTPIAAVCSVRGKQ